MSGGSYGYFFLRDPEEVLCDRRTLSELATRLEELDPDGPATRDAKAMPKAVDGAFQVVAEMQPKLAGVFQAVEWLDSADYGEDQMRDALRKYAAASAL